jgi:formylglycine-generating enzyme required for sulfatase activity
MVSGSVFDLVRDGQYCCLRPQARQGIAPVPVYRIVPTYERNGLLQRRRRRKAALVTAGALLCAAVAGSAWFAFVPAHRALLSAEVLPLHIFRDCADCPELVEIPSGAFERGSPSSEPGHRGSEGPVTRVAIRAKFAIGRYPVTFGEWDQCVRDGCKLPSGAGRGTGRVCQRWTPNFLPRRSGTCASSKRGMRPGGARTAIPGREPQV